MAGEANKKSVTQGRKVAKAQRKEQKKSSTLKSLEALPEKTGGRGSFHLLFLSFFPLRLCAFALRFSYF